MSNHTLGATQCAGATLFVGASVAVTAQLTAYPLYGGQAVRFLVAGVLLSALLLRRRRTETVRQSVRRADLVQLALLAAVGMLAFNVLLVEGARHASASLLGAMLGASPIVLAIVGPVLEGRRPKARTLAVAGLVGVGVVVVQGGGSGSLTGVLLALGVALCEAGFSLLAVPLVRRLGPLRVTTYASWLAVPMFVLVGLVTPGPLLAAPTAMQATCLVLPAVLCGLAAVAWYAGMTRLGADKAGPFVGLMPVSSLVAAVALGSETLSLYSVLGVVVITA